jgi:hypothetical protein
MTGEARGLRRLAGRPLLSGMLTATLASTVGIAVNIATAFANNPIAWAAVAVATVASGGTAAWISKSQAGDSNEFIEEIREEEIPKRLRSEKRSASRRVSKGVVKRRTIEIRPDGTRLETIEFFSEELARGDT